MSEDDENGNGSGTFRTKIIRSGFNALGLPDDAYSREVTEEERLSALDAVANTSKEVDVQIINAFLVGHNKSHQQMKNMDICPVTKLRMRRSFDKIFQREYSELKKSPGKALAFGIIDLDHFKLFNDVYGHQVGDFVLAQTGGHLKGAVRASDFTARWGGEELVFLLPDGEVGQNTFEEPLNRIEEQLCAFEAYHDESITTLNVGSSIAVVVVTQEDALRLNEREIFDMADQTLYFIKNTGRGRMQVIYARDLQSYNLEAGPAQLDLDF